MAWHLTNWKWPISMWYFGILGVISEAKSVKVPLENVTNRWFNYHSFNISWPENEKMSAVVNLWRRGFLRCDRSKLPPKKGGCFIYYYFTIVIFFSFGVVSLGFFSNIPCDHLNYFRHFVVSADAALIQWNPTEEIQSVLLFFFDSIWLDSIRFDSPASWIDVV